MALHVSGEGRDFYGGECKSILLIFIFFFSSRRRHTRYIGDWSSDVCSSDLGPHPGGCNRNRQSLDRLRGPVRERPDVSCVPGRIRTCPLGGYDRMTLYLLDKIGRASCRERV